MPYYAVHKGREIGIFSTWKDCEKQVKRFPNAKYKKFKNKKEAEEFVKNGPLNNKKEAEISVESVKETSNLTKLQKSITIYTDGSCVRRNNKYFCGYGYYIPSKKVKVSKVLPKKSGYKKTNNRAELIAIIEGVQHCLSYLSCEKKTDCIINIYTDSRYSILIGTGTGIKYKKNNWKVGKKNVKNKDLVKKLVKLTENYVLKFHHVFSHTHKTDQHSIGNDIADKLAMAGSLTDFRINS